MSPRRRSALAAAVVGGCLALVTAGPLAAQTGPSERSDSSLALEVDRLDAMVTNDDGLRVRTRITNASRQDREDLRVLATVHVNPIGRFNYQQAMDEGELGRIIHGFSKDLASVPARGSRSAELTQTAAELGLARPGGQEGVYPLRLQLLSAGEVVDEVITNLVYSPMQAPLSIAVSLLLGVTHPPGRDGQGMFVDESLTDALRSSGALGGLMRTLEDRPGFPVTLAVDALTLEEAGDVASGYLLGGQGGPTTRGPDSPEADVASTFLDRFRDVAARPFTHVLAQPYASADLVGLTRAELDSEVGRHVVDGAHLLESMAGVRPVDTILWPPAGVNPETLVRLRGLGVRRLVLSEAHLRLPGPRGDRSPSPIRQMRSGPGTTMPVLVPDPWIERTLEDPPAEGPLLAQRILGEVANVYFEAPGTERRGVLITPPHGTELPSDLLAALADGLGDAPFAEVVTLTSLLQRVERADEPVELAYPPEERIAELPLSYLDDLEGARRALGSLEGVLIEDRATPARFDRVLLQAASVHYRDDLAEGRALLGAVTDTVDRLYSAVSVPDVPPVTLTSVEGQLPVTVRSSADVPLRLRLELRTASYEIDGGPTREIVLQPDSAEILTFQVRALRPGRTDGVAIVVTDADGVVELAAGTVVVRSTAFSVAGVVITAGAALFLLGWGMRELARRRRQASSAPPPPAGGRQPAPSRRALRPRAASGGTQTARLPDG